MADDAQDGERLAKVMARSGLCSRRDAETWIKEGRVSVNGKVVQTPAFNVSEKDKISVDGTPLAARQGTRVWMYHKPPGLVVTEKDPEGRETIFDRLDAEGLPRVVTIGRLDINTEGLLLLTNDGGLKRVLELPATGWLRRYRVRAFGTVTQPELDSLKDGTEIDGVKYGPIEATLEREQGSNVWLVVGLREGKNREVKNVLGHLGLEVNRLIRVSFGPFQLGDLAVGAVEVVKARVLREQLGKRIADAAGVDFESDMPEVAAVAKLQRANPKLRATAPGKAAPKQRRGMELGKPFNFVDRDRPPEAEAPQRKDRPGRPDAARRPPRPVEEKPVEQPRRLFLEDGSETTFTPKPQRRGKDDEDGAPRGPRGPRRDGDDRGPPRGKRPGGFGDKPGADRPPRPRSFGDALGTGGRGGSRPERSGDAPQHRSSRPAHGSYKTRDTGPEARPDRKTISGRARPATGGKPYGTGGGPARQATGGKPYGTGGGPARAPRPDRGPRPEGAGGGGYRSEGRSSGPPRSDTRPPRSPRPDRGADTGGRSDSRPARSPRPEGRSGGAPRGDGPPRSFGKPGGSGAPRSFAGKPGGGAARSGPRTGGAGRPAGGAGGRPSSGGRPGGGGQRPSGGGRPSTGSRPGGSGGSGRPPRKPRP